ncbi:MAG: hypothetical protein ABI346_07450 [Candidatus Baltobacteraceae bacterium]
MRAIAALLAVAFATSALGLSGVRAAASSEPAYPTIDQARALTALSSSGACGAQPALLAQSEPSATPSAGASSPPSPVPSGPPSYPPIPRPARGPGTLLVPTPLPSGSASPTPAPPPTPTASPTLGPVELVRPSPSGSAEPGESPSPEASPSAIPTLGPNQIAILGDRLSGSTKSGTPADFDGNVHIFYSEGVIVGDHAHYDGDHTATVTGHPYIINRAQDSILRADVIVYDSKAGQAYLTNGTGSTSEGVDQGRLYYKGTKLTVDREGKTHADRGSFTTCDNPRGGYHVESKTIDVLPGNKLVARKNVLFLGALGIFYLPILIVPLKQVSDSRRQPSFIPEIGYDSADGFYVKARLGFAPSDFYYGYYRVEEYTKRGTGLGYVAFIGRRDYKRQVNIDTYLFQNRQDGSRQYNANVQDTENFTQRLRGQFNFNYTGDYGPYVFLPPGYNLGGSIVHTSSHSSENYQFARTFQGSQSSTDNLAFVDQLQLSRALSQGINLSFTDYKSAYTGQASSSTESLHIQSLTHLFTKAADYTLTVDRTDSTQPFGYDREPEFQITPHFGFESPRLPYQLQLTYGYYTEQQNKFSTERSDILFSLGPALFKVFHYSDFSAGVQVDQDLYGTGDAKAQVSQDLALTTQLSPHIENAITYTEQNPLGPSDVPFQLLDRLSGGNHQAQDTLRFFNGSIYQVALSTGTFFNREAQPVLYQVNVNPSSRSAVLLSGAWNPGAGNGFGTTNVQLFTPFGRETYLEFATNVDWKNKGRLEDKTLFYKKTIGECYNIYFSYNQDQQLFNLNFEILAFPGRQGGFGISPTTPLIPQSLNY